MKISILRSTFSASMAFGALIAMLAAGALAAAAQGPCRGMGPNHGFADHRPPIERAMGGHGHWWNNPRIDARLKLTADQRTAMDHILYQHREKLIDLQAHLEHEELAMQPLMGASQPDRAAMEAQIDKIVNARAALERAHARFLLDIRMQLTAEQWSELRQMRRWMRNGRPGRMGRVPREHNMWRQNPGEPGGPPAPAAAAPANPSSGNAPAGGSSPGQPQGSGQQ